jgi:hypothetical protein
VIGYRIFVIGSFDEFYGGVRFFEGQNPGRKAYVKSPYIDNLNILLI